MFSLRPRLCALVWSCSSDEKQSLIHTWERTMQGHFACHLCPEHGLSCHEEPSRTYSFMSHTLKYGTRTHKDKWQRHKKPGVSAQEVKKKKVQVWENPSCMYTFSLCQGCSSSWAGNHTPKTCATVSMDLCISFNPLKLHIFRDKRSRLILFSGHWGTFFSFLCINAAWFYWLCLSFCLLLP